MSDSSNEFWRWSARAVAAAVRRREISAREVTESSLRRIEEINGSLNALVDVFPEEALASADAVDAGIAAGLDPGGLAGVPTVIKINTDQAGHASTHGARMLEHAIAEQDAPQVANLRRAGAVFVGRGNSPAFGYRSFTSNDLHGRTLSPWNPARTPGGSSGGSSVAVATGMAPIGQGNDLAGSIRYPAYASGVAGLRPTVGRIPRGSTLSGLGEPLASQLMTVDGPIARDTADLRPALAAMSGRGDTRDLFWSPAGALDRPASRLPRVGLIRDPGVVRPDPHVEAALDAAAADLSAAGHPVEEVGLPLLEEAYRLGWFLLVHEQSAAPDVVGQAGDEPARIMVGHYRSVIRDWWGPEAGFAELVAGYARRAVLIQQAQEFLERYPLLLMPVSAEIPFEQDMDLHDVEGTERFMRANWSMMAVPCLGLPALAVPTGTADGLPLGVQLVGRRWHEEALLDAGEIVERRAVRLTPVDPSPSARSR